MSISLQELLEYHRVMAICEHHGIDVLAVHVDHVEVVRMLEELLDLLAPRCHTDYTIEVTMQLPVPVEHIVLSLPSPMQRLD